jgi:hypothetical protein
MGSSMKRVWATQVAFSALVLLFGAISLVRPLPLNPGGGESLRTVALVTLVAGCLGLVHWFVLWLKKHRAAIGPLHIVTWAALHVTATFAAILGVSGTGQTIALVAFPAALSALMASRSVYQLRRRRGGLTARAAP